MSTRATTARGPAFKLRLLCNTILSSSNGVQVACGVLIAGSCTTLNVCRQAQARQGPLRDAQARARGPLRAPQARPQAGARAQGPLWCAPCCLQQASVCVNDMHLCCAPESRDLSISRQNVITKGTSVKKSATPCAAG